MGQLLDRLDSSSGQLKRADSRRQVELLPKRPRSTSIKAAPSPRSRQPLSRIGVSGGTNVSASCLDTGDPDATAVSCGYTPSGQDESTDKVCR